MLELLSHSFLPEACYPSQTTVMISAPAVLWDQLQSTPDSESDKYSFLSNTNLILNCELFQEKMLCGALRGQGSHSHVVCMLHDRSKGIQTPPKLFSSLGRNSSDVTDRDTVTLSGKSILDEENVHTANHKMHAWNADFLCPFLFINQTLF